MYAVKLPLAETHTNCGKNACMPYHFMPSNTFPLTVDVRMGDYCRSTPQQRGMTNCVALQRLFKAVQTRKRLQSITWVLVPQTHRYYHIGVVRVLVLLFCAVVWFSWNSNPVATRPRPNEIHTHHTTHPTVSGCSSFSLKWDDSVRERE